MHSHYLILHYDGTRFSGWQRQLRDRTVQAELEAALSRLDGRPVTVHGAGRTDAGVHSLGQVASFRLGRSWEADELRRAVNANTPRDIWIAEAGRAPDGFHARKQATARTYRYVIGTDAECRSPFRAPFEWALGRPLSEPLLHEAAAGFRGEHDFRAFASAGQPKPHYRCTVHRTEWRARDAGEGFIFTIEANRFLHRMVRFLVGYMTDVARDRRPLHDLPVLLAAADNRNASPPAPPQGLYFVSATYPHLRHGSGE